MRTLKEVRKDTEQASKEWPYRSPHTITSRLTLELLADIRELLENIYKEVKKDGN